MATITGTFNSLIAGTISGSVATPGATGPAGPTGATGATGPAGPGVPSGGLEGQVLLKVSDTSYDTAWFDNYAATVQATVRNETGSTLTAGTVVYISGGSGNKPLVTKASASTEASSSKTFAILAENISTNNNGQAVTMGLLKGLDTSAFTAGANLWLSTTAGQITQTMPTAPNHAVFLGNVVRVHATQGEIEVRIQNGYELQELHNVKITSVSNGQVLKYDSAQGLWVNGTDSSGVAWGGITGTLSSQTDLQTALDGKYSTTNPAGYITSSALTPYLTSATAASTYQPLSGMSSYLTSATAASTYYPLTNPSGFITSSALTPYAPLAGATFTGKVNFKAGTTSSASVNLAPGVAPTSPTTGDLWYDSSSSKVVFRSSVLSQAIASEFWVTAQSYVDASTLSAALAPYLTDAPSDGTTYGRNNGAWVAAGGGGGASPYQAIVDAMALNIYVNNVFITYDTDPANLYSQGYSIEIQDAVFLNNYTRWLNSGSYYLQLITKDASGTTILERTIPAYLTPSNTIMIVEDSSSYGYTGWTYTYLKLWFGSTPYESTISMINQAV